MTTTQLAQAIAAMPRYTDAECMAILAAAEADMERAWDEANRAKTQARMAAKREELRKKLGCE